MTDQHQPDENAARLQEAHRRQTESERENMKVRLQDANETITDEERSTLSDRLRSRP
jgi:hypothetical protein